MSKKVDTKSSSKFQIAETDTFSKNISDKKYSFLHTKIKNYVYPILKNNPFFGANIKKLKGDFANCYRYRIGKYRLFYTVDKNKIIIFVIDVRHRKESY